MSTCPACGEETPDGFLILRGNKPLIVHASESTGGALYLSNSAVVIELRAGAERCGFDIDDRKGGTLQRCIQPRGIYLYANALGPEGRDILRGVVESLEVRNVRPRPAIDSGLADKCDRVRATAISRCRIDRAAAGHGYSVRARNRRREGDRP